MSYELYLCAFLVYPQKVFKFYIGDAKWFSGFSKHICLTVNSLNHLNLSEPR
jgi:hypothetical protein